MKASPLQDQVRSSLDSSHPTLRVGVVAVLGGIWEIVFCAPVLGPAEFARSLARVSREMSGSTAGPEAYGLVALGRDFNRSLARRPYGHDMITRLEHIGDPWQRKPGPCIPSRLTGRIMALLDRSGEGSRLASIAPICSNPARGK